MCMRNWLSTISLGPNMGIFINPNLSRTKFTGTGCVDVNECLKNECTPGYECKNTVGSFICMCGAGYEYVMSFELRSNLRFKLLNITFKSQNF